MSKFTERHLQAIWYDEKLRPRNLRTTRGAPVRVVEPGEWNLEAGPDFLRAVLDVAGTVLRGDVEIHLRPGDWRAHGHTADPAYAHVIAHVTWFGGESPDVACPSICLGDFLRTTLVPEEIDVTAYPYANLPTTPRPCARPVDEALALAAAYGRQRLTAKARRQTARFLAVGREQTFYEEVFAALGYKYNTFPFRAVAETLRWRDLPRDAAAAETALTCAAGLRVTGETPWRLDHVRPANAPEKRLAAAARLFARGPILRKRLLACALETREGERAAAALLREGTGLGAGRAGAILANAVVPHALAVERLAEVPAWIFPEDVSRPVRLVANRLLGRDHNPALYSGNGLLIQGLIQIHRVHCLSARVGCGGCTLSGLPPTK